MMKKLFEQQIAANRVVTKKTLGRLGNKNYTNGDPIKVGDHILYAWREVDTITESENTTVLPLELITLNIDQIDQYNFKSESLHLHIPVIIPWKD